MAEFVAGRGTTALSIIGTVLGGIGLANGGIGNVFGGPSAGCNPGPMPVSRFELEQEQEIASLRSQIALRDANTFTDNKLLDMYKYFNGEIQGLRHDAAERWAAQGIINSKVDAAIGTLGANLSSITTTLANITRTAVPASAICNFGCSGGCTNI